MSQGTPRRPSVFESVSRRSSSRPASESPKALKVPEIPETLIQWLEKVYPPVELKFNPGTTTNEDLRFYLGQRDVVRNIRSYFESQQNPQKEP